MANLKVALIVVLLLVCLTDERKKKKKPTEKKTSNPLDKRPDSVKPELYCDACQAILKEAMKELRGKKKESDVIDYMTTVCDPEKYYVYSHPPPDMRQGCEAFVNGWDEEIEQVLVNRKNDQEPIEILCYQMTKACDGVDPTNVPRFDNQIMMDGQPMQLNPDGSVKKEEDL